MKVRQRHFWFNEPHDQPLTTDREIVVDCFAGGGGASVGLERAIGHTVDVAINHDKSAIAMHMANHPETKHYCENLWDIDPVDVCEGRPVGAVWFSPDCTHFSKAKGKKPRKKEIRALAWIVCRWAARVQPRVIFLENVEEFVTWGPLKNGQPVKELKGKTFEGWVKQLQELGYQVEWRNIVASDFGTPTTRKRLFLVARCDGQPIQWPEPTHGSPAQIKKEMRAHGHSRRQRWRTAAEIIDWSIPCPSIFLSPEEAKQQGCRRPLAEKTMRRIAEGVRRYVIEANEPFIVKTNHGGDGFRGQDLHHPLSTVTARHGFGVVTPFVSRMFGNSVGSSVKGPIGSATQENKTALVAPTLIQTGYGERPGQAPRCLDLHQPLGTVVAGGVKHALVAPFLTSSAYTKSTGRGKYIYHPEEAVRTITTTNDKVVIAPALMSYYGPRGRDYNRGRRIDEPIPTQPTENRFALVSAFIAKHFGGQTGVSADVPFPTVTMRGTQNQIVAANLVHMNHGAKQWSTADDPLRTVTAQGQHHAAVESTLQPVRTDEVRAFLFKYYGSGGQWNELNDPAPTITAKHRLALGIVLLDGHPYQIVDIGMRMLTPRELFNAQGFPSDYDITTGVEGKPATKSAQVARCGNSVCPQPATAIVAANYQTTSVMEAVAC